MKEARWKMSGPDFLCLDTFDNYLVGNVVVCCPWKVFLWPDDGGLSCWHFEQLALWITHNSLWMKMHRSYKGILVSLFHLNPIYLMYFIMWIVAEAWDAYFHKHICHAPFRMRLWVQLYMFLISHHVFFFNLMYQIEFGLVRMFLMITCMFFWM